MNYTAYETLVKPARPSSDLFRLFTGMGLTAVLFFLLSFVYSSIHQRLLTSAEWEAFYIDMQTGSTPTSALMNLYLFGLLILALWVTLVLVHGRGIISLVGPLRRTSRQFWRAVLALLTLYLAMSFLPAPDGAEVTENLPMLKWLQLLPLALGGLLVQTATEELLFRGYLQSQLAARFSHPAVWIGIPTIVFAFLHYDPSTNGDNAWLVVIWAALFGLAAADLTARSGTLGPAIALHMVNNVSAILIAAPEGYFNGLTLYTYPFSLDDASALWTWMPVDLMVLLCSWLAVRLALRR